jgi:plastocyanin
MKKIDIVSLMVIIVLLFAGNGELRASIYVINTQDYTFSPSSISTVMTGDTLRWVWVNGSHTTTSVSIPSGAASWDHPINSTSTSFDYVPTMVGTYNYHCSIHFAMGMTGSFTVSPLGVPPLPEISFLIYPNPFIDNIHIRVTPDKGYIRDLKIYDPAGRILDELTFTTDDGINERTINLAEMPQGILFLYFLDNNNNVYVRRVYKL